MSYTKITNFAIKDSTNDIIKGTEFDDEFNSIEASFTAQPSATQTLTNKTVALGSNTVSGTTAQFNTALSDGDFATLAGSETLTNKALNGSLGATTPSTVVATSVGISTANAANALNITASTGTNSAYQTFTNTGNTFYVGTDSSTGAALGLGAYASGMYSSTKIVLQSGSASNSMTLDASGNLLVGKTTAGIAQSSGEGLCLQKGATGNGLFSFTQTSAGTSNACLYLNKQNTGGQIEFQYRDTAVGNINITTTTTAYATSSDYRLKDNISPMVGALDTIALLKPVTYTWKADGSDGQGFIAHELAEVCPDAVQGKKDAVDAEGNPVYQGIDTSFLVATLTAAIQEQQALITSLTARLEVLEAK